MYTTKNDFKFVRSLGQKKFRQETGCFIAEGLKLTREAIASAWPIQTVYTTDEAFLEEYPKAIKIGSHEMEMMSQMQNPSAHLVVLKQVENQIDLSSRPHVCIIDGVSDPGNLGTIIRTAEWFGVRHIFCTDNGVEITNPKVVQATMGSIFRVQMECLATNALIEKMRAAEYLLCGAVLDGVPMHQCHITNHHALVIGSESHGISNAMREALSIAITIPGELGAESLNASIATGILLAEFHRQWHLPA